MYSGSDLRLWIIAEFLPACILSNTYTNPASGDTAGRVHRLLSAWPSDDNVPADGIENLKSHYKKITAGLHEIKTNAERDAAAIDEVMERLQILIALRKASEAPQEKRPKRPRARSPSVAPTPAPVPAPSVSRGISITVPPRNSVGPQPIPFSREPKARREALAKQLPLQEGRKVAFHPPQNTSKAADGITGGKDEEWILAVVTKCINQDKNRYEVQDPEPQEDGQPGQCYNTTLRAIIPLPDPSAPPDSAAHLNAYPEFTARSTVMALYPDTSCFYRAEVVASPKDMQPGARVSRGTTSMRSTVFDFVQTGSSIPMYKLKFEDDDDQEHNVSAQWVVEWPGGA
ncbi:hypothetical protein WOLCODRAFT_88492 [Wolfiporia cocos MD-104 SS10]|uniref:SGF29 C-terminal domain-containing protein n=1 Tax=Wolfiporia cocos (strain MD-104) TaxID=742152 RepID=A0A2H3JD06_WOLCO|nr:hypothetical protein WOLCODRAFT_88492 [Wolfiporia cocos MD-104 SS10]